MVDGRRVPVALLREALPAAVDHEKAHRAYGYYVEEAGGDKGGDRRAGEETCVFVFRRLFFPPTPAARQAYFTYKEG